MGIAANLRVLGYFLVGFCTCVLNFKIQHKPICKRVFIYFFWFIYIVRWIKDGCLETRT